VRFHRPVRGGENGMGLNPTAQACLKAVRRFCSLIKPWECTPNIDLLLDREENEAYMLAHPGKAYGLLLTGSFGDAKVGIDLSKYPGTYTLTYMSFDLGEASESKTIQTKGVVNIEVPGQDSEYGWLVALIKR
jgi:hypothetical protein